MANYQTYKELSIEQLNECLEVMECQPILFIGSGLSKRYFNAPNWPELLHELSAYNPIAKEFAYYKQIYKDNIKIGTKLAECYSEWAWSSGREEFDPLLFTGEHNADVFFKYKVSEFLSKITPKDIGELSPELQSEISLLKEIRPHAIITTNYDRFVEMVFSEYVPVIGQQILKTQYTSIGEIFKIHGCVSQPSSIVIHEEDYCDFNEKKKYLSAKLLTYFLEHPIIILGYGVGDPNIQALLSDIDEILASNNELVPNIFMVNWKEEVNQNEFYPVETLIRLENEKSLRIHNITASDFSWVYESLINENAIENVNPKLLRALLSRTYKLVRTDIPKKTIEIDYDTLERALGEEADINKIYGITTLSNPSAFNISYPYTLTDVANKLGFSYWSHANDLIKAIETEKSINIKKSDNRYHICVMTGKTSKTHKYSQDCIDLLEKIKLNQPYELSI
ncbi:SIR2 family protein [Alkaliphilus pronyensis]|uniref:SIR2 family protein n=1 Tax=Alkaliphilus pronyensis TaxID=1482732 RepID=A0A6I0FJJ0_9FIRM|nr:SIR2 family protein [Alkaliphilus pronyensis]KAB3536281.1 SIR2 family protein [Alkaliphilus pronyensis]